MIMVKTTVNPNCLKNCPMIPCKNAIGPNTEITTKVVAKTASATSFVPSIDARIGDLPISKWRKIFSLTTMASSINSPTAKDYFCSITEHEGRINQNRSEDIIREIEKMRDRRTL